jgi:hypothetical protein
MMAEGGALTVARCAHARALIAHQSRPAILDRGIKSNISREAFKTRFFSTFFAKFLEKVPLFVAK